MTHCKDSKAFIKRLTYKERIHKGVHPVARKLLTIADEKKTNLIIAADVTTKQELFDLADSVGPHICALKTHIDILTDFDKTVPEKLKWLARKHNFLLFEDSKFADIGNTVQQQFSEGIYRIADWADMVTVHLLPGKPIISALKEATIRDVGFIVIAQMSSLENLLSPEYTEKAVEWAHEHKDSVIGFVCQERLSEDPDFLHFTPGIRVNVTRDDFGQIYNDPHYMFDNKGIDFAIVGRGITHAADPKEAALLYQDICWQSYLESLSA